MKRVVNLTESDLFRIVKRVLKENTSVPVITNMFPSGGNLEVEVNNDPSMSYTAEKVESDYSRGFERCFAPKDRVGGGVDPTKPQPFQFPLGCVFKFVYEDVEYHCNPNGCRLPKKEEETYY